MANSDEVVPSREIFFNGDVAYRRAVSESLTRKQAAQNNFINKFQNDTHRWCLNGSYSVAAGLGFYDGVFNFFHNTEIVGVYFWNGKVGTSGITAMDINYIDTNGVDKGSIFSSVPIIDDTSSDGVVGVKNLITGTEIEPTGVTLPEFGKTTFLAGESVYMKLNLGMISGRNCGIALQFRPIN